MRTILRVVDSISEWTGKTACWLALFLVLVMTYGIIMRYVFRMPLMWAYESSIMMGAAIYALGWSYTLKHHGHVRIDVFYTRLSARGKAIIDVVGALVFLFPLFFILIQFATVWAWRAWEINEKIIESYWYPPAAPIRTVIVIGFIFFALQAVAELIRNLYLLIRNKPCD